MASSAAAGVSYEVYGNGMAEADERDRLIVALDFGSTPEAQHLVDTLGDSISFYKIGITLQFAGGLEYARRLADQGKRVFLDSKLFDIEEQVRGAVESIDRMGVDFLTVHGSKSILADAVSGRPAGSKLKIFAVTVLTSLDDDDLRELGFLLSAARAVSDHVASYPAAAK